MNGNLADWVFEPAENLSTGICQAAGMCPVEFGDLPLAASSEETVSFSLHKDLFGDLLRSYGSGALSIGDSLILFCSVQGMMLQFVNPLSDFSLCCKTTFSTRHLTLLVSQSTEWLQNVWEMLSTTV